MHETIVRSGFIWIVSGFLAFWHADSVWLKLVALAAGAGFGLLCIGRPSIFHALFRRLRSFATHTPSRHPR